MLSKSEYMMFLKHPAWLWLKKYDKKMLPAIDEQTQARFDAGNEFEQYAEALFPNSKRVGFSNYAEYLSMPQRTQKALQSESTLFQARFESKDLTCITDVLKKTGENEYELIEIKSSTDVKDEHITELAFQMIVLEEVGIRVTSAKVVYVNKEYVRNGAVVPNEFVILSEDLFPQVLEMLDEVKNSISQAHKVIASKTIPDISARFADKLGFRDWLEVYKKMKSIDERYTVYELAGLNTKLVGYFEDNAIYYIRDIPEDFELNKKQESQVRTVKMDTVLVDKVEIDSFIHEFQYPLYFFDYETLSGVVPPFDGTKPYQQIPFQYSLHILDAVQGSLSHKEYLPREYGNPVLKLIEQMKTDFGNTGSIITWNKRFEIERNNEIAEMYPEHAEFLHSINDRIVDLMIPFWNGWYAHKDFHGSASLKAVLPVLVPDLSYKALNISTGAMVGDTWTKLTTGQVPAKNIESVFTDLLKYCELDTFAMVKILEVLNGSKLIPEQRVESNMISGQSTLF